MALAARPATPADAERIAQIYNEGIEDRVGTFETRPRSTGDIRAWFDGRHPIVVVEDEGEIVAFASTSNYRTRECYAGIAEFSVYVARVGRGRGAGTAARARRFRRRARRIPARSTGQTDAPSRRPAAQTCGARVPAPGAGRRQDSRPAGRSFWLRPFKRHGGSTHRGHDDPAGRAGRGCGGCH